MKRIIENIILSSLIVLFVFCFIFAMQLLEEILKKYLGFNLFLVVGIFTIFLITYGFVIMVRK